MRKQVTAQDGNTKTLVEEAAGWLDLEEGAQVEVSSEAPGSPIENALVPGSMDGWQAAVPGPATIRLRFDTPQPVRRVMLQVSDTANERSQEWTLSAELADGSTRELIRQQWNFSPGGSTEQKEEYAFNLERVQALKLTIDPDRGRDRYPATLVAWRVGVIE